MAPMGARKRARAQDDDEEEVITATSHLGQRNEARKRVRRTGTDDDDDDSIASEEFQVDGADDAVDVEEDEFMDDEAVQRLADQISRQRGDKENHPADNSIIEEVTVTNFMCHAHLTISMGPLINFIIGHNGSGKSAVLTALQLCLGGKATATNRGQSLKSFIKEGKEQATLSVKIKNQGDNAYRPEEFGGSIIVERVFSRAGTSGFKIKNANGKILSTRKSDLEDILDAMALQMDNPMNVLTQDMARQFLNSSNATDKYKFFYQGTHLEQLDSDYRILQESLESNQQQAYNLQAAMDAAKATYREARAKLQKAEQMAGLEEEIDKYKRQMAWVQVQEQEQDLANIEQKIREQEAVIEDRRSRASTHDDRLAAADDELKQARDAVAEVESQLAPKQEQHAVLKEQFDDNKKSLMEMMSQARAIKEEITNAQRAIDKCKAKLEEEQEKIANEDNGRHAEKLRELQDAKEEAENLRQQQISKSAESGSIDRAIVDAEAENKKTSQALEASVDSIRKVQGRLRTLQGQTRNWLHAYDSNLPRLLKLIDEEGRFREKPVGPLGHHVSLLKPQWSKILEKQAGGMLNDFAVTSKADQVVLSELMRRSGYNVRIHIGNANRITTSQHEPPEEYLTWLRVLKIDHDLVRNTLIINQAIDKTVLEADPEKARDLLEQRIPNVGQVFTFQASRRGAGGEVWGDRLALTNSGAPTQSPIQGYQGEARMQTDTGSQVDIEKEALAALQREQAEAESARGEARKAVVESKQAQERHRRAIGQLDERIQRQETLVQDLTSELEAATPQTGIIEETEQMLKDHQETLSINENQYQDSIIERDRVNAENREKKAKLNALNRDIQEHESLVKKAQAKVVRAEEKRHSVQLEANEAHEVASDADRRREALEEDREQQLNVVNEFTSQANQVSPRVPVDDGATGDLLDKKIAELNRVYIERQQTIGGDKRTLELKKIEAQSALNQRETDYGQHNDIVKALKKALADRRFRWEQFRRYIVIRAKATFQYLLSERAFRGQLIIDHNIKSLDLKVQPDSTALKDRGRQTKTLSGGEKSFSTICLLLALWEAMGSPVRCLDEFDVFMDSVNRDISMQMMIKAARRSVSRQFILITPQSMGNVHTADDVKIHKMSDPERGQTTLAFPSA